MSKKLLMSNNEKTTVKDIIKLEYLEFTGEQYIDTGYIPTMSTKVILDCNATSRVLFDSGYSFMNLACTYTSGKYNVYKCGKTRTISPGAGRKTFCMDMLASNFIQVNSTVYSGFSDPTQTSTTSSLLIGCEYLNDGITPYTRRMEGYIYSFKIYENGELVRDFIPALDYDNIPCLYENINKQCYYNQGTGTFSYS